MKNSNKILNKALEYNHLGFSVIPILHGTKRAAIAWKQYQQVRPDENLIRTWFSSGEFADLAVICGRASGGLTARDFDAIDAYEKWATGFPDLANSLPTVETSRGMHIFFRSNYSKIKNFQDGELRGNGYCLLPPSRHPNGSHYRWKIPLNENLVNLDPIESGFLSDVTERTEQTQKSEQTYDIIRRFLPGGYGERHYKIFKLARSLKSEPEYSDCDVVELRSLFRRWFHLALPNIRTKDFTISWYDFINAWGNVKFPIINLEKTFQKSLKSKPPGEIRGSYPENKKLQIFTNFCRELQCDVGCQPFFLSTRKAGFLLGVSPMQISRFIKILRVEGYLELVEKGGGKNNPRKASRYRYVKNLDE